VIHPVPGTLGKNDARHRIVVVSAPGKRSTLAW
jgi:hypothetical protein